MSRWHDLVDWVSASPFEVAVPEVGFEFFQARGVVRTRLKTCAGGHGCHEFRVREVALELSLVPAWLTD